MTCCRVDKCWVSKMSKFISKYFLYGIKHVGKTRWEHFWDISSKPCGSKHSIGKVAFYKAASDGHAFNQFCPKSVSYLAWIISMTAQSLKTIRQSNLNLERTQALKLGGSHLGNKIVEVKVFFSQKWSPFTLKQTQKTLRWNVKLFCCNEET